MDSSLVMSNSLDQLTEFAPGEWIGVALEQPAGEYVVEFGY